MKILVVSESMWNQGVVYDLHIIAEGLSARGHQVYALDPGSNLGSLDDSGEVRRLENSLGVVRLISPRLLSITFDFKYLKILSKLLNILMNKLIRTQYLKYAIQESQCEVILLYSAVRLGPECVRLAKKLGIPVAFRNVDKLYNLYPTLTQQIYALIREHKTYPHLTSCFALTPSYGDYMISLGSRSQDVRVAPFPLDTEVFAPLEKVEVINLLEDRNLLLPNYLFEAPLLVFVGTFYEFGGLEELIREAQVARQLGKEFRILLVGDGPVRKKLDDLILESGLSEIVFVTGYQPFELMPLYIGLSDVCINVFPINSRTKDIFSAKIIQYLSCAKPVVSSALPGIMRAVESASSGVVYASSIQEVLSRAIELASDVAKCENLGRIGRKYVLANNSSKSVLNLVEASLLGTLKAKQ